MSTTRPLPTDAELQILQVLWGKGPQTVREVHDRLAKRVRYTTVLKLLQNMLEKNLVVRDASQRSHVFAAAVDEASTTRRMVEDLRDRVFHGSTRNLILGALSAEPASADELEEIEKILEGLEDEEWA